MQEIHKPGRRVRWEHVPAHVNVYGNEVANGLAVEGMCSNPLWSQNVRQDSDSESTLGLQIGFGCANNDLGRVGPTAHGQGRANGGSIGHDLWTSTRGSHSDSSSLGTG